MIHIPSLLLANLMIDAIDHEVGHRFTLLSTRLVNYINNLVFSSHKIRKKKLMDY